VEVTKDVSEVKRDKPINKTPLSLWNYQDLISTLLPSIYSIHVWGRGG